MKIEHLEEFVDLAKTLNFTKTAKEFYITQPVLSKHIATLEQDLGGRIFDRSHQGVALTPFGKALLPTATSLVGDKNRLLREAREFQQNSIISVKVGYLDHAARDHLPMIQQRFGTLHPEVKVSYLMYEYDKIMDALDNGSADIIIGELSSPLPGDIYVVEPAYDDTFFLLVKGGDSLANEAEVRPEDLVGRSMIIPDEAFFGRGAQDFLLWLKPDANGVEIVDRIHDANSIPLAVNTGSVIGPTLGHVVKSYSPGLKTVPLADFNATFHISVIWRKEAEKSFYEDFALIVQDVIQEFGYE